MSRRVAGQRHPAERTLALAEQRPDVGGHEPGIAEGVLVAVLEGQPAQRVAVVERLGAGGGELADRRRRAPRALSPTRLQVVVRIGLTQHVGLLDGEAGGDVAVQRVVGRGLVGDHVDIDSAPRQLGQDLGGVAGEADRQRAPLAAGGIEPLQGVIEIGGSLVEIAGLDPALDPRDVDLDAQRSAAEHRDRQRLRAAHAAEAGRHH